MLKTVAIILVLSDLCLAIRVPTTWESDSEVQNEPQPLSSQDTVRVNQQQVIPAEYFVYTAEKPQFAAEIAAFHGVQNPKSHYKAYPIRPYTGKQKPELGKHQILDENKPVFQQYQDFTKKNEAFRSHGTPVSVDYEVFHPYKAEEPALQQIYKDPVLAKIRDDIRDSQHRLQNYENEAGKPDISENEYLESPEQTDRKKFPQRNVPAPYELHRPQRKPVYYRPVPIYNNREQVLNHRFRHPWNQNFVKVRPAHYRPLKNHIGHLRQHHAVKFDDERNEYPQLPPPQMYADPIDGYDIYEKGKQKYVQLRNNVDESINQAVKENHPIISQKLEIQDNGDKTETQINDDDEEEFVPVKNYAQVRKTETTKHLPREAAFDDAESFDEIRNAPRLREAIKSTKAQTVYTEEGYEDAAYDHAGEQKHASENEGHAGYLKEKEISGGKFKAPTISAKFEDEIGKAYQDQTLHGEQWQNSDKNQEEQSDVEDYSEDDTERSIEADIYQDVTGERSKREKSSGDYPNNEVESNSEKSKIGNNKTDDSKNNDSTEFEQNQTEFNESQHELNKRETNFKIPEINFNTTFLSEEELLKMARLKLVPKKEDIKDKYPYYFENLKSIHKHSPLRYAENLKLIPRKSKGGTEFYDSRSRFECPEVDEKVDAIPEKLKKKGHPDDDEDETSGEDGLKQKKRGEADFDSIKDNPRLKGLGDKIDCFKAKYFGENPLDSPFFKEDIIANPEPVTVPNLATYKLIPKELFTQESKFNTVLNRSENLQEATVTMKTDLLDKLKFGQKELQQSLVKTNQELRSSLMPQNISSLSNAELSQQSNVYSDILDNIKAIIQKPILTESIFSSKVVSPNTNLTSPNNLTNNVFNNNSNATQLPTAVRKKRATPFVYEPYKIIRDSQVQDSRKTTTTSNISPLIKQLQSSKVVDRVTKVSQDKEQPVKRNVATRTYKDIGRKDREQSVPKEIEEPFNATFVDLNIDERRGEPRYELRRVNHKSQYTPVENKKAMSLDDYQARTNKTIQTKERSNPEPETKIQIQRLRQTKPAVKPYFDVSQFLPKSRENQKPAASNKVSKIVKVASRHPDKEIKRLSTSRLQEKKESSDDNEDYEEYDDEEETTTTTTTLKPIFRRRTRTRTTSTTTSTTTTTTAKPHKEEETELELPKLRLITRFRNSQPSEKTEKVEPRELPLKKVESDHESDAPKYREKKKKTEKSTLVTDTKTYNDGDADGDEEDNVRKKEVDGLIGVKQDMDEYTPSYEREVHLKSKERDKESLESSEEDNDEYDDDDDEDFDKEENDDDDDEDYDDDDDDEEEEEPELKTTTPEPTKRTLARTTEAPVSTTEARNAKLEMKPIVMKKKIEIHKELPINRTSPHVTQFKQDIKEIEIIKEIPTQSVQRKPQKNLEALELYKDEQLAKEVNKLGAVEIFKQNLDLRKGPRHGGNYRSAKLTELQEETSSTPRSLHGGNLKVAKEDTETSQSENSKLVELSEVIPTRRMHGGNYKLLGDIKRPKSSDRNAKLELGDTVEKISTRNMHGGNLRPIDDKSRRRGSDRSAKLIEFDDERDERDDDEESTRRMHGGNFKSYSSMDDDRGGTHGGNYRSAKIVQADANKDDKEETKKSDTNARSKAAVLLNSFAQAVPILTTTPAYILDPSKRMYYYVED